MSGRTRRVASKPATANPTPTVSVPAKAPVVALSTDSAGAKPLVELLRELEKIERGIVEARGHLQRLSGGTKSASTPLRNALMDVRTAAQAARKLTQEAKAAM